MLCPQCHKESELVRQDADVVKHYLSGSAAVIVVHQKNLCGNCFNPVEVNRYRMEMDLGDRLAAHQGEKHRLQMRPTTVEQLDDHYEVSFTILCSCDGHIVHTSGIATADAGKTEEHVPWM